MSESMIERVARAIWDVAASSDDDPCPWSDVPEDRKEGCRLHARAAVAAMLDPTPEVWRAMIAADRRRKRQPQTVKRDWQAGVLAALNPPS